MGASGPDRGNLPGPAAGSTEHLVGMMLLDAWWDAIRPEEAQPGAGILCARCILDRLGVAAGRCVPHVTAVDGLQPLRWGGGLTPSGPLEA